MILVVGAHPGDESVGASSVLLSSEASVLHVTDGAPRDPAEALARGFESRESYAAARDAEARAALALAGIPPSRRFALRVVEREAPLRLAALTRALAETIERVRPDVLITHAYEGGHPDHDAAAFAAHAAIALLRAAGSPHPALSEMTSYHRGPGGGFESGVFLGGARPEDVVRRLDAGGRARKLQLLARYRTQWGTLRKFRAEEERFRPAPSYDFTRPPHAGRLWYESFPWGMSAPRFGDLVRYALLELGLRQAAEPVLGGAGFR
ncbi:MAG TPA: PIG-L family deacetylase [Candidatus Binatia bacterium]|nr:PIG-L family deacetylase [Candidatus Binatia bacterium]